MEIQSKQKEMIEIQRQGSLNKFSNKTTAKDFKSWLSGQIGRDTKKGAMESVFILQEVMKAYNYYETVGIGKVKSWKGKSGIIEVIKHPDRIILVRMRKSDINEEPKRVEITITKQEVNAMITALNLNRENQPIDTSKLAMDYSKILGLGHSDWERFFADRKEHNKLTTILSYMDEEGLIAYSRRGKTKILSDKLEVQMLL